MEFSSAEKRNDFPLFNPENAGRVYGTSRLRYLIDDMKQALEEIRQSIPPYAPWHYDKLDSAFDRYLTILNALRAAGGFEAALAVLYENAPLIRTLIDDARSSGSPLAYDRAAMELTWDVESLLRMVV